MIYIMCLRNILSDVKADIMKLFIFYIYITVKFFHFFWKKDYKFRKPFFLIEEKKMNFDFEGMKSFSEDTLNLKDIST